MTRRVGRWVLNLLLVGLLVALSVFFYGRQSRSEHALCVLRDSLVERVNDSSKYLFDVQHGRRQRIPGITDNDIKRSIAQQRQTIGALSGLRC